MKSMVKKPVLVALLAVGMLAVTVPVFSQGGQGEEEEAIPTPVNSQITDVVKPAMENETVIPTTVNSQMTDLQKPMHTETLEEEEEEFQGPEKIQDGPGVL